MSENPIILFDDCLKCSMFRINEVESQRTNLPEVILSEKEIEVLKGVAQGRSYREIDTAIRLNFENDSYDLTIQELLIKFEAASLPHVVYKALKMGFLE